MKTITGNILDIKEGWICHQVNLKGVAGKGLAKQIKDKYPKWYEEYHKDCIELKFILGDCSWFDVVKNIDNIDYKQIKSEYLVICNMFAQEGFGTDKKHTNYYAFAQCLSIIKDYSEDIQMYFPYKIGCGLGGGDWKVISEMIETAIPDAIIVVL